MASCRETVLSNVSFLLSTVNVKTAHTHIGGIGAKLLDAHNTSAFVLFPAARLTIVPS